MPAAQRIATHSIAPSFSSSFYSQALFTPRTFFLRRSSAPCVTLSRSFASSIFRSAMSQNQRRGGFKQQKWKQKPKSDDRSSQANAASGSAHDGLGGLNIAQTSRHTHVQKPSGLEKAIWKPKSYGTLSGPAEAEVESVPVNKMAGLSKAFTGNLVKNFTVDDSAYSQAQIRATFYPKFENEKSDQEVRTRMIEVVSNGLGTLEVSLKHSGSLFMYAGSEGGAYAKNSFGNIYTAVGVFVLGRMFREAWGTQAAKKQADFNNFLERNRMCISMELVTAVLGDHGQRPKDDYAVVTAVTELCNGKPKFYSTPEIIAFCRKWRLTTNHVWLFSTRKSVTSFFAAFDALCEEGTASSVCRALDEISDISVPGSKDHIEVQGEILEGLVARIVTHESSKHMDEVLRDLPLPPADGAALDLGPSLREICRANRSDEKQQIKALLQNIGSSFCPDFSDWLGIKGVEDHPRSEDKSVISKILEARPADYSTMKVQEMLRLMRDNRFPAAFKCYHNFQKLKSVSDNNLFYKMVIHVRSDSAFRRYHKEMRNKPGLWPLYRGFFVDINLFKANKERVAEVAHKVACIGNSSENDDFANDDANLMIKLKFLTYKLRTFLIRNGLSVLFKNGPAAYKAYYLRQMKIWGTSTGKQRALSKMLDEWAVYIGRKYKSKPLSSSTYLSEAEPFLEQYAKRSLENQSLIGSAGSFVRAEDFLAIIEGGRDEEGDLEMEREVATPTPDPSIKSTAPKPEGLIVFFPGIPGCAKSALCKELLNTTGGLGDGRPVHSLMGDLIKGKYWQKVADDRRKRPYSIMLADKNAPNEEVWEQIENMCHATKSYAVPVVPDSAGSDSNPFSLDALAIFMYRVLQRVKHPGNLDKGSPNAGYVLLMFYHLYEGKSREGFDAELVERFGSLVKMPLLKPDRDPLPESIKSVLEEGISLYGLHTNKHGRADPAKGSYAKEWVKWEQLLREVLSSNAEYLKSVQVPFDVAVKHVLEELKKVANGDYAMPSVEKKKYGTISYAAVSLPVSDIGGFLDELAGKNRTIKAFIKDKNIQKNLRQAHVTLAHKRSHGVTAVANYGVYQNQQVPVEITALLLSETMAAFEARVGSIDGEKINSKNEWPHITLWTANGVAARDANMLPQLVSEGKATRIGINPPGTVHGTLDFF